MTILVYQDTLCIENKNVSLKRKYIFFVSFKNKNHSTLPSQCFKLQLTMHVNVGFDLVGSQSFTDSIIPLWSLFELLSSF